MSEISLSMEQLKAHIHVPKVSFTIGENPEICPICIAHITNQYALTQNCKCKAKYHPECLLLANEWGHDCVMCGKKIIESDSIIIEMDIMISNEHKPCLMLCFGFLCNIIIIVLTICVFQKI